MKLRIKLALANLLFKLLFISIFVVVTPWLSQRINLYQTDNELIEKREDVIALIAEYGVEPFITSDTDDIFASYNILKEEYIVLEQANQTEYWNYIEVSPRRLGDETIDYRVLNYGFLVDEQSYLLEIGKSLPSIAAAEDNVRRITWLFLLAFLLISSLFEMFYTGVILRPFKQLTRKIAQTDDPEKFETTPLTTGTSDFKVLDQTLNALMEKIKLQIKNEKQITQNISHELLTPVSTLRLILESLLQDETLPEQEVAKVEEALHTLHRLKTLVNALLKIARIESSQYLKNEKVNLGGLLKQVVEELDYIDQKANEIKGLISGIPGAGDIIMEKTAGLPQIKIDYDRSKIAWHGADISALNRYLATAFGGETAGLVFEGERRFDLVLRFDPESRTDIEDISRMQVPLPGGAQLPLSELADIYYTEGPAKISRENTHHTVKTGKA